MNVIFFYWSQEDGVDGDSDPGRSGVRPCGPPEAIRHRQQTGLPAMHAGNLDLCSRFSFSNWSSLGLVISLGVNKIKYQLLFIYGKLSLLNFLGASFEFQGGALCKFSGSLVGLSSPRSPRPSWCHLFWICQNEATDWIRVSRHSSLLPPALMTSWQSRGLELP